MLPSYYEYHNPVKILAGRNALDNIPHELDSLDVSRPIIVTDAGVVKAGLIEIVKKSFDSSNITIGAIYDKTPPDSSNVIVNDIAGIYRKKSCDSIIAVGGGSAIDTAKGVNIVVTEETDDLMKFMGVNVLRKALRPFIVVPTTAGTGSEVTQVAVIRHEEKGIKMLFPSPRLYPNAAVLDPRMTRTMPPHITAATGMDALTHAVEAYTCMQKNPMSDAYALAAIDLIRLHLVEATKSGDDLEARMGMANAALMAGAAFSNSMVGMVHGLGHACGGVSHIPHGVAMGVLLPFVMEYNLDKTARLYGELLLPLVGADEYSKTPPKDRAQQSIEKIKELRNQLNRIGKFPITLKEAGVKEEDLEKIAKTSLLDGAMIVNPVEVDLADALDVLKKAYTLAFKEAR